MHSFPSLNIFEVLAILLTGIISLVISTLLITFIGLFSFIVDIFVYYYLDFINKISNYSLTILISAPIIFVLSLIFIKLSYEFYIKHKDAIKV